MKTLITIKLNMEATSALGTIIMLFTAAFTYKGFKEQLFMDEYIFHVDPILKQQDYKRLVSSGFLHANWIHFGFNMIALVSFATSLEILLGVGKLTLLYFISLIGGSLLSLYIHKMHGDYRALGASGAVSGVAFAFIILFPEKDISFIFLPEVGIRAWVFGLFFIIVSIFGIKSKEGNIGHDAHLGGAIVGGLLALVLKPADVEINWLIVGALLLPTIAFLILIVRNPAVLMIDKYWGESVENLRNPKPKAPRFANKESELNFLLDKIAKKGIGSLSRQERKRLEELKNEL